MNEPQERSYAEMGTASDEGYEPEPSSPPPRTGPPVSGSTAPVPQVTSPPPLASISTPLLIILWIAFHTLVVLELPDCPISPSVARFFSGRLWYPLQCRLALAPPGIPMSRTHETLRWLAAGRVKARARWARDSILSRRLEAVRFVLWFAVMHLWMTRGDPLQLDRGKHGRTARALSTPLPSIAMSHLHIGEIQGAIVTLTLATAGRTALAVVMPRIDGVGEALRRRGVKGRGRRPVMFERM